LRSLEDVVVDQDHFISYDHYVGNTAQDIEVPANPDFFQLVDQEFIRRKAAAETMT